MTEKSFGERAALFARSWLSGEKCAVCGEHSTGGESVICPSCREKLRRERKSICMRCGLRADECVCVKPGMKEAGCFAFLKLFFYSHEGAPQNRIIFRLKNRKDRLLCSELAGMIAPKLLSLLEDRLILPDEAVICPVPRSRKAASESGTDQAFELARALAKKTGIAQRPLIRRLSDGKPQKGLDASGRRENVKGLFGPGESGADGFTVILVDDVVTTGATVCECARVLAGMGAAGTVCVAIASDE